MNVYSKIARKRRRKRIILRAILIIAILIPLLFFYNKKVVNNIVLYSQETVFSETKNSLNNAIKLSLNDTEYGDLINVEKNTQGDVIFLSANSLKINKISKNVVEYSKILIDNQLKKGVDIPIWTFSGITFLSGYGKDINYKFLSIGSVSSEFISEFTSEGLNQTKHSIYIQINVEIKLIMPFSNKKLKVNEKILVCESILLGKVPEIYFN